MAVVAGVRRNSVALSIVAVVADVGVRAVAEVGLLLECGTDGDVFTVGGHCDLIDALGVGGGDIDEVTHSDAGGRSASTGDGAGLGRAGGSGHLGGDCHFDSGVIPIGRCLDVNLAVGKVTAVEIAVGVDLILTGSLLVKPQRTASHGSSLDESEVSC